MSSRKFPIDARWLVPSVLVLLLASGMAAGLSALGRARPVLARPLPQLVSARKVPPTTAKCIDCHSEIGESFKETGHAQTLWPGNTQAIIARFAGQKYLWPPHGPELRYVVEEDRLWLTRNDSPLRLPVDWFFGSGHHAQTPVSLTTNPGGATELRQHALSWYPSAGVAPTLGRDAEKPAPGGMAALGQWLEHASTTDCFGCHTTHLPLNASGEIASDKVITGVGCVRCHYDAARHVAENGKAISVLERWSEFSPRKSVNRCGECHRRADQAMPGELKSDRLDLVRFAPIGLTQSRCFTGQDITGTGAPPVRLDCVSCHDPHGALSKDRNAYRQVCLSCHAGGKQSFAPHCASQPGTSDCLACHMPTVETDPNLRFTDHWIRIRKP